MYGALDKSGSVKDVQPVHPHVCAKCKDMQHVQAPASLSTSTRGQTRTGVGHSDEAYMSFAVKRSDTKNPMHSNNPRNTARHPPAGHQPTTAQF
eukprot:CAMPEP_0183509822 /NCGR_PEP_ID=MMETSP0371-20130417/9884_1 /TAXON_ID=268820 /ORGANISM="Peridinium aciculiferum, Strain PAER-2" /LENGTH=93 /DNA_ID=CAMNT_0025706517 /DNA_START=12 /DNA_END=291 /DNA_ORIENTATION=+